MANRLIILLISLLVFNLGFCQKKDSADCVIPFLPFFTFNNEKPKNLSRIDGIYYKNADNVFIKYTRDVGSARSVIVTSYHKVEGADIESFKSINGVFSKDKNSVFYNGFKIEDADPDSFTLLTKYSYSKDKNHIYFKTCKLKVADSSSFNAIDNNGYYDFAYDSKHLYFYKERIKIDSSTFKIYNFDCKDCLHNRCRDKNYIYHLCGTSFDGYIKTEAYNGSIIKFNSKNYISTWTIQPYGGYEKSKDKYITIKAKDKATEKDLLEKIYRDYEEQLGFGYKFDNGILYLQRLNGLDMGTGTYKLNDFILTLNYGITQKIYKLEPLSGNYFIITENVTEHYQTLYPDLGITEVIFLKGLHTD